MPEVHAVGAEALCLGRADVVLVQHLEHAGSDVARPTGDALDGKARDGQRQVPGDVERVALDAQAARHAAEREDSEPDRADVKQERAEHEGRHRVADSGEGRHDLVGPAVLLDRGQHAEWYGDDDGQRQRCAHQQQRGRRALGDELEHRTPIGDAQAPGVRVPDLDVIGDPADELLRQRLVEAVDLGQSIQHLRPHVRHAELGQRITGGEVDEQE